MKQNKTHNLTERQKKIIKWNEMKREKKWENKKLIAEVLRHWVRHREKLGCREPKGMTNVISDCPQQNRTKKKDDLEVK